MSSSGTRQGRAAAGGLQRVGAAELLTQELRERILAGQLRPGDPLRETELAETFSVARNTVREALRLLTRDGLGVHAVHHGVAVRTFTKDEVRDIFEVRRIIEECAALRAGELTQEEIESLERQLDDSERAFAREDNQAGLNANMEFHRELVRITENQRLELVFDQILTEVRLILTSLEDRSGGVWIERNRRLFAELLQGTPDGFLTEIRDYMTEAYDEVIELLPDAVEA